MKRTIGLACLVLLVAPPVAGADSRLTLREGELSFVSEDAGIANRLTVGYATRNGEETVRFADDTDPAGMSSFPTPPCTPGAINSRGNPVELFCSRSAIRSVAVDLGPNEDVLQATLDQHPMSVVGGLGTDALTTGAGDDFLAGGQGDDTLVGGAGNDHLDGGEGADTSDAGEGDDRIVSADGVAENIACGPGTDTVSADSTDALTDCENVTLQQASGGPGAAAPDRTRPVLQAGASTSQRVGGKRRRLHLRATASEPAIVQVTGYLDAGGIYDRLRPATATVTVAGGGVDIRIRLSRAQLRRIAKDIGRARRPRARITMSAVDAAGNTSRSRHFWIRLRG